MGQVNFAKLTISKRGDVIAGHLYRFKDSDMLYLAAQVGDGKLRLFNIRDGGIWSFDSTFGSRNPQDFTDLGKIQVEVL